jgi:hypothetical protein
VCAVVCVRLMTCVPHAGDMYYFSAELWRFTTSTRGWERVDGTAANGAGPNARYSHVITSIGLDLWVHGGITSSGEGDRRDCCCCCSVARSFNDCVCCGVLHTAHDSHVVMQV